MAQVFAQQTHGQGTKRLASKTQVARLLYEYGYSLAEIQKLLRLVDWMMRLPRALDALFIQEVDKIRLEKKMAFVTSFERVAKQKGLAKGRSEEHTSELQSLMRISYDVFCLKKKKQKR